MREEKIHELISSLVEADRETVSEFEAKEILRAWGLPVPPCLVAGNADEAISLAEDLGYPVALKVYSSLIIHKTDAGGVKLNLMSDESVDTAFNEIRSTCSSLDPDFKVLVQPMVEQGLEVILGVSHDLQFGPAIMFGMGGVFVELYKDVSFRLIPADKKDALEMIASMRAFPLLKGYRGKPGGDIDGIAAMIVSISDLVTQFPAIHEIDMNPVILYPQGAAVVDARIVLKRQ